eukprot:TRINITY_DN179_c0_g1_i1.p3 TRINITY_DN179_c0_g1~~TRINITY_DN179_c0_g1_i1.p3  ORF type:complete len:55 (-),score=5.38 TRINITY_DN179_c0_g1_i1:440-604(-)
MCRWIYLFGNFAMGVKAYSCTILQHQAVHVQVSFFAFVELSYCNTACFTCGDGL